MTTINEVPAIYDSNPFLLKQGSAQEAPMIRNLQRDTDTVQIKYKQNAIDLKSSPLTVVPGPVA